MFLLVQSADHITPLTGATPTVTLSKNGGAFASPSGAVTEVANGWYKVAGNATDSNTLGPLVLHATAASGDPTDMVYQVVAFNPQDSVRLGLTAIPNATAGASGGLPTLDANLLVDADAKRINAVATTSVTTINANVGTTQPLNFTGTGASALVKSDMTDIAGSAVSTSTAQIGVNVVNWGGTATAGNVPPDTVFIRNGTAQAGGASTITLDAGASATNNFYQNEIIFIRSGTGAGQAAIITTYVGSTKVATINGTWATNPSSSSVFSILPMGAIPATVSGSVTVGGYSAGQDPGTYVLATPANKLLTNASGDVTVGAYAASQDPGTYVLITPANKLLTDASGHVTASIGGNVTVGGYAAGQDPATLVLDTADGLETGITVRQGIRYSSAALAGVLSGAGTTTVTIDAIGNASTQRVQATVDTSGNRTAVTLS